MDLNQDAAVVIVGAGQAGLAMAQALTDRGLAPQEDIVVVDAATPETLAWHQRWDSLKLFTPAWYSGLPGLAMPGDPSRYPLASDVADYLDSYRAHVGVVPGWGVRAQALHTGSPSRLVVTTNQGDLTARVVVAASGPFSMPRLPAFADRSMPGGASLHSDLYRNPGQLPPGPVLVVGSGNTGLQIARELAHTHSVSIARGAKQRQLPQQWLGVDLFRWLKVTGMLAVPVTTPLGRRMASKDTIVGPGVSDLAKSGVQILPRAVDAEGDVIVFEDAGRRTFETVIWATGYRPGFGWLPADLVQDGRIRQRDGATAIKGLFVIGSSWQRTRGSALLGGVGDDARRVASHAMNILGAQG